MQQFESDIDMSLSNFILYFPEIPGAVIFPFAIC